MEQENNVAVNTVETQPEPKNELKTTKTEAENEQSTISAASMEPEAEPKDEPMNVAVGCKKFFAAVGMTLTVPCE